jgi:hypothetical protein
MLLAKMERRLEQMIQVQVTALAKSMPAWGICIPSSISPDSWN